ncbi:actin-related protein 4 [Cyclospora cayetanensis]|uniref:Actin-related protein 4 n=1 Tax=Cyclospora cayetanensis TaxID=88456 RepID=A0A6P6RZM7_9EIME|nr:actin-related protein 4 [Cyclospora cayetanensis]
MTSAATPLVVDLGCHSLKAGAAGEALPRVVTRSVVGVAAVNESSLCSSSSSAASAASPSSSGQPPAAAAAAAAASAAGEPLILQQLLNPLEKTDHVEVLPVLDYKATRLNSPGTYVPHSAVRLACWGCLLQQHGLLHALAGRRLLPPCASCVYQGCNWGAPNAGYALGSERGFLFAEPNITNHQVRETFAEIAFELLQAPEVLLVRKAALAAFGCARTSAVVCDMGHSNTSVAAVQEGFVLQRLQQEIPLGCMQLLSLTRHLLQQHHIPITPGYAVVQVASCPHVTKSFQSFGEQHVLEGPYILPDGTPLPPAVTAAIETAIPDALFCPSLRDVLGALVVAGGGSQFPGLVKKLKAEVAQMGASTNGGRTQSSSSSNANGTLRLVCSRGAVERHMASWIGGSIVGCLGTFSQLAITRSDYQEFGPRGCVDRKCP